MPAKTKSFEANLKQLEAIVSHLENGDVPLDEALTQFKKGVQLSNHLQSKLTIAKKTLAKMMNTAGKEVPYDRDKNGQDVNNQVDAKESRSDA